MDNTHLWESLEKQALSYIASWNVNLYISLMRKLSVTFKIINVHFFNPSVLLLGFLPIDDIFINVWNNINRGLLMRAKLWKQSTFIKRGLIKLIMVHTCKEILGCKQEWGSRGFPSSAVVKNPPANAGETGSSPGPGRSHRLWSNKACTSQLLILCSRAREPQLLKPSCLEPVLCNKRSHDNEKPAHHNEE